MAIWVSSKKTNVFTIGEGDMGGQDAKILVSDILDLPREEE